MANWPYLKEDHFKGAGQITAPPRDAISHLQSLRSHENEGQPTRISSSMLAFCSGMQGGSDFRTYRNP